MAQAFHVDLLTPQAKLVSAEVNLVLIPGVNGEFGVLANHAPVISSIADGAIRTEGRADGDEPIFVSGGFVEVTPDSCTILAEYAVALKDVSRSDVEASIASHKRALDRDVSEQEKQKIHDELNVQESLLATLTQYA